MKVYQICKTMCAAVLTIFILDASLFAQAKGEDKINLRLWRILDHPQYGLLFYKDLRDSRQNKPYLVLGERGRNSYFNSGNLGIGTRTPAVRLHISGNGVSDDGRLMIETTGGKFGPQFRLKHGANHGREWLFISNGSFNHVSGNVGSFGIFDETAQESRLVIDTNGNVGIGTRSPQHKLHVAGTIVGNETKHNSDIRWKKDVKAISNGLDKVLQLRGITFQWRIHEFEEMNFSQGSHYGFVAQEVEQIVPELVTTADNGYKSLAYANMTALLVEAIKEQQKIINEQKAELQESHAAIANLTTKVSKIEAALQRIERMTAKRDATQKPTLPGSNP